MTNFTAIEKKVYGLAAAQSLCIDDEVIHNHTKYKGYDAWFAAYLILSEAVETGTEPEGIYAWQPMECWAWSDILGHIEDEAMTIQEVMRMTLDDVKEGIVQAAIDGSLDSDMNTLDMFALAEAGAAKKETQDKS